MNTPNALYSVKPWSQMSTPKTALIHPVTMPVVLSVAMNRKASGTPPKLANTPDAVITTWRSILPRLAV